MGLGQLTIDFCAILLTVRVETENHVREDSIKCMISFFPSADGLTFGGCWADRSFCSPLLVICYTALSLRRWLLPKKKKKHSLFWFPREFFKKPLMSITTSILTDEKAKIAYHDFHHTLENQISSYISPPLSANVSTFSFQSNWWDDISQWSSFSGTRLRRRRNPDWMIGWIVLLVFSSSSLFLPLLESSMFTLAD